MSTHVSLLTLLSVLATPLLSIAAVVNGGFETGNLTGWNLIGSGHTATTSIGVAPTEGSVQGYIETTGNFTALAPAVVSSLGITPSAIIGWGTGAPVNGTGLWQDVTVPAGATLNFDWDFLTDELNEDPMYNDFAFFTISSTAFFLASRNASTYDLSSPPPGFDGQTDWATESYTFASAGTYRLGFAVFNVGDSGHNSVLLVDNVSITAPEPGTLCLAGVGAAALALGAWRRRGRR